MTQTKLVVWLSWVIGAIIVLALLLWALFSAISYFNIFTRELNYLKEEINRTTGSEQRYWIKRKRKLWLSLLPFVKY